MGLFGGNKAKVGIFDIGTRMKMSQIIMGWKGKCPECGGRLGMYKCKKCGADVQEMAARQARLEKAASEEVDIPDAILKKQVRFLGGHKSAPDPVGGWLGLLRNKIVFKNALGVEFEIPFNKIKDIRIVDDKYTPSLGRTFVVGAVGGNTDSQSFRPHKSVLQVVYNTGKRNKELEFNFIAVTWAGAVDECQRFYSKFNAILD